MPGGHPDPWQEWEPQPIRRGMRRYWLRLGVLAALIVGTGLVVLALGYSASAVVLGMVLTAALCWAPALLALEGLSRTRRYGPDA